MKQLRAAEGDEAIRQHFEGLRRTAWEWRRVVDFFLEDKFMFSLGKVSILVFLEYCIAGEGDFETTTTVH